MSEDTPNIRTTLNSLSLDQRARLRKRLAPSHGDKQSFPGEAPIPRAQPLGIDEETGAAVYPASPAQARMFFLHEYAGGSPVYSTPHAFRLVGPLDKTHLEHALFDVIDRHEGLRTVFHMDDDGFYQKVLPEISFALEFADLRQISPGEREAEARRLINESVETAFDLTKGPLFRVLLVRQDETDHALLFLFHHIITDGWSMANFHRELSASYNARKAGRPVELPDLPAQMPDYATSLNEQIESGALNDQFAYWEDKLKDEPAPLDLQADFQRPREQSQEGDGCIDELDTELVDDLWKLARKKKTTFFTVLAAVFKVLIHRRTGETDLLVGIPVANRLRPEVEPIIGCFINTLVLRTDLSGNPSFESLVDRVRQTTLEAYSNQEVPFDKLIERLKIKRYPGHSPLFQVHLNLQEFGKPTFDLEGTECSSWVLEKKTTKFDLSFAISRRSGGWQTRADYRTDLFKESTIRQLLRDWKYLLRRVCAAPETPLASLFDKAPASKAVMSAEDEMIPHAPECFHVRFERQVAATPDARALLADGKVLSYRELNARSNEVAHYLRSRGVGPDVVVGLCADRSPEMIIGLLGILKAGGAYIPLDPEAPARRNNAILRDAGARYTVLVSGSSLQETDAGIEFVFLDDPVRFDGQPITNPEPNTRPENLVYILYTSGSTGDPKGVMVEHRNLDAYVHSVSRAIPLGRGEYGWLQPLTADTSQTLLASALTNGSCLHLISRPCSLDAPALIRYFNEHPVDVVKITPTHLSALLDSRESAKLLPRKVLIMGGEALTPGLVNRIARLSPTCGLWNHYGPTETTVGVLTHKVGFEQTYDKAEVIPIGRPLAGVTISVIDEAGRELPAGKKGELVIGGHLVTRGYLNHPRKTSSVFIGDPANPDPGARRYRTGDLVRITPDGLVEFHGRRDHQVKIRGFRIELGEIEAALGKHPSVAGQVVVFRDDTGSLPRLDAYVVNHRDQEADTASIFDFLKERLPAAMIPATVTFLEELPRTSMGKVDRKALPFPDSLSATEHAAPSLEVADVVLKHVLEGCVEVLKQGIPAPRDNFFEIGGHSLSAMQLLNRVSKRLNRELPLKLLFDNPVLEDFAKAVRRITSEAGPAPEPPAERPLQGNEAAPDVSRETTPSPVAGLHQLFEEQVKRTPDDIALICRGEQLHFADLNVRANRLAFLLRERGLEEKGTVAILMDRSPDLVIAMLAVLKSGGAWLPLDPEYPASRLHYMLENSAARLVLTSRQHASGLPEGMKALCLEELGDSLSAFPSENPDWNGSLSDPAYLIYTSGSTGQPKGAPIPHRAIVNHMVWMQERFPVGKDDAILQKTPGSFDASIWEFFLPLISGARLVLAKPGSHRDPQSLIEQVIHHNITIVQFVPLGLELLTRHPELGKCRSLKRVFCGGEALPVQVCRSLKEILDVELVNLYGPSEAAIDSSFCVFTESLKGPICPIGKAVANIRLHVLDNKGQPVTGDQPGELYIAGPSLADGYLNRPELTAESFLPDPFAGDGERMYRTGDRVRKLADGNLEFLGRMDDQIKLNGFRIEPGEIESAILAYPGVSGCAVSVREDAPGERQLVAYITNEATPVGEGGLRNFIKERLPKFMMPTRIVPLEKFPFTPNGKINRAALPDPESPETDAAETEETVEPDSAALEFRILKVFAEVLQQPDIKAGDDFFDRGGHSLMALRALARIREFVDEPLTATEFFDHPTATGLAGLISGQSESDSGRGARADDEKPLVHHLFEQQAEQDPSRTAIRMGGRLLSYAELDESANRLAHALLERGVVPDQPVGIFLNRSPDLVVSVLGILKAGGACLPVDPGYPQARIGAILEDACPETVITETELAATHELPAGQLVLLDEDMQPDRSANNPACQTGLEDLAYVLYTSGSTGTPKGVQVPHRTLQNLIGWQMQQSGNGAPLKTLQFASLNFDVSFQEIFSTLATGGTLVMVDEDCRVDMAGLARVIRDHGIQRLFLPYVVLDMLAEELLEHDAGTCQLREVITAGEQLKATPPIRRLFKVIPDAVLVNQYGPTETHVVTAFTLGGDPDDWPALPPIGQAIDNARILLLDDSLNRVPAGETGEIFVGGLPVARGYLKRDDLTRERFIPSPFDQGEVLYRTGDLAVGEPDGNLRFLGRNDHQVKIRGFRVELGEVEATLMTVPGIRECVVLAQDDSVGLTRLHAFIIPASLDNHPEEEFLKSFLEERLPDYMVPSRYSFRESFPLNANGKVDRMGLVLSETVVESRPIDSNVSTVDRMEGIWKEVLELPLVEHDADFFDLGGHSLLATRMISRIRKYFGVDIPIRVLFEKRTMGALSDHVDQFMASMPASKRNLAPAAPDSDDLERLPASFAQQRLWFIDRFEGGSTEYNMAFAFRLHGRLEIQVLEKTVAEIVQRHGTLRTCFQEVEGDPYQVIYPNVRAPVVVKHVDIGADADLDRLIDREIQKDAMQPFDLRKAPLVRFKLLVLGEDNHVFVTTFHHVISDGWSIGIYFKELETLYNSFLRGEKSPLEALEIQYPDYTRWQRDYLSGDELKRQLEFWRDQMRDLPRIEFPADFKRPERMTYKGGRLSFLMPTEITDKLKAFNRTHRVTPFMTFMTAFQVLISRYTGQGDIAVGTPIANRQKSGFDKLIGFFANTLVIRNRFEEGSGFAGSVKRLRNNVLDIFQNQDLPFEKLVEDLNPPRELNRPPLFQILFALQNAPMADPQLDGLEAERVSTTGLTTHFDLELHISEKGSRWEGHLNYSSELFERETISEMADNFLALLNNLLDQPDLPLETVPLFGSSMRERSPRELPEAETLTEAPATDAPKPLPTASTTRKSVPKQAPLSFVQERIWFIEKLEGGHQFHMPMVLRLRGDLDPSALEQALQMLINRHDVLRTRFIDEDGQPFQVLSEDAAFCLEQEPLLKADGEDTEAAVQRSAQPFISRPFALDKAPLLRARLLHAGPRDHVLILVLHHLIADGWSVKLICNELDQLYRSIGEGLPVSLPDLPVSYMEYSKAQREELEGSRLESLKAFWLSRLADCPALSTWPSDRERTVADTSRSGNITTRLDSVLTGKLHELCRDEGVTPFTFMLTVFRLLLSRHSGQDDLVIGTPVLGRKQEELERVVGCFLGTVPLRTRIDEDSTFRETLRLVQNNDLDAFAHEDLPFEQLVEIIRPERSLSYSPIFQILFNYFTFDPRDIRLGNLELTPLELKDPEAKYDMTLYVSDESEGMRIRIIYDALLYDAETLAVLINQYTSLVESVLANPDKLLSRYRLVSAKADSLLPEPCKVLSQPYKVPVTRQFVEMARQFPEETALLCGGERLSYGTLAGRSAYATAVLQENGVQPGDVVALSGSRSFTFIAGLLGILRARGVLLIVDPDLPDARKAVMLEEAGAAWRLNLDGSDSLPSNNRIREILLPMDKASSVPADGLTDPDPGSAAYVFFTSGTTGVPKGILGNHKGLSHFIEWERSLLEVSCGDRVALLTGFSFDVILRDIFLPLTSGATLCLPPESVSVQGGDTVQWLRETGITILHSVPSVVESWLSESSETGGLPQLRQALIAGEPLTAGLVQRWRHQFGSAAQLINLYGATETTLAKTFHVIPEEPCAGVQPIGRPMPETQILILGSGNRPCGIREPGQIAIRTPFMSSGYVNGSEADNGRFIQNPFRDDPRDRVYLTGDLGYLDASGLLHILGRLDDQIKLRGVRIEPAEIAVQLEQHPSVRRAFLTVCKAAENERILVAYVVFEKDQEEISPSGLREFLRGLLPEYLIPGAFVTMDSLPLSPNGKVNRKALPQPDLSQPSSSVAYEAPRTPAEETIAAIWQSVLKVETVGRDDDFFEIGGHSLMATRVIARMRRQLDEAIPLRSIFEHPTVASLAQALGFEEPDEPQDTVGRVKEETDEETVYPVSYAQQRLWFLHKFKGSSTEYNMAGAMRLKGPLDRASLQKAFQTLVDRHDSLRTRFTEVNGEPFQIVTHSTPLDLEFEDRSEAFKTSGEASLEDVLSEFRSHSFDLGKGPLIRVKLVQLGHEDHLLLRNIHHIVSDGWSNGVFNHELSTLYAAYSKGESCPLKPLSLQYPDYAAWQRKWLSGERLEEQTHYWRAQLASAPSLDLQTDLPRPSRLTHNGARLSFEIPQAISGLLNEFNLHERVTSFMTLLAALKLLMARYSGQSDITMGTPVANRQELDHENLIGFFVNTLPLRTDLSGAPDFRTLVKRLRYVSLDAFSHQDLPFDKIVEVVNPERDLSRHPIFQVIFVLQNAPGGTTRFTGLEASPYPMPSTTTHFDLEVHFWHRDGCWFGSMVYNTDLFRKSTIERMQAHYTNLLEACLKQPDQPLETLHMLDPGEFQQVVVEWNRTDSPYPRDRPIHELFREQARLHPEATALEQGDKTLSYAELDAWSDQMALRLQRGGVNPGDRVGVCLERSMELVVTFLAILKTGSAYVPLARDYPVERLKFMLKDADLRTVVSDAEWPEELRGKSVKILECSEKPTSHSESETLGEPVPVEATKAAYVIYTSGSTGRPKGTIIPHRGVVRLVKGQDYVHFAPGQRFLLLASPSFDASTFELWGPLLNGGSLAIYSERFVDTSVLEAVLRKYSISCIWLTTGLFNLIVDTVPELLGLVKHVLTGGEACSRGHIERALTLNPDIRLTHCYGPTECTTFATTIELHAPDLAEGPVTIGRPIAHTQAYILDESRQPVPVGVAGELYIGGDGLSTGYLNRPELTQERFVANPFSNEPRDRLYRTGDICRYLPDGQIDFIGRRDNQVKVRGFRVETGEIESVLHEYPFIERAAIRVTRDSTGMANLIAYYTVPSGQPAPEKSEVKAFLSCRIPDYAVPSAFECVPDFPLTPNGKINFAALPEPGTSDVDPGQAADRREDLPLETRLIRIWEKLFQRSGIRREDNFFDLGGHSLMAARLAAEIELEFDESIPIATLFESPTVEELARRLKSRDHGARSQSLVALQPSGGKVPLFCIHGWGGEVFGFLDLARTLAPDRPVYGLQAVGLDGKVPKHNTVEEMASHYANEMIRFYPDGPYYLIGYSAGGWIAYAVAQELKKRGKRAKLSMLDTGMSSKIPYWLYAMTRLIHLCCRLPHHFRRWYHSPASEKWTYLRERLQWLKVNILRDSSKIPPQRPAADDAADRLAGRNKDPQSMKLDHFIVVAGNYKPKPYSGELTLFAAKGSRWYSRVFWKYMIRGSITIHFVDGGHHGLIDQNHVGNFSCLFKEVLEKFDRS